VAAKPILVEVAYAAQPRAAEPPRAIVKQYRLDPPATLADALRLAAADAEFRGVDIANAPVGVFGKLASADQWLNDGDRIEIYRPLTADPKVARRQRAQEQRRRRQ
jgi:putative ubiquitin-RnfH superfamily antitoxin RatB of RatAB toxin-antitoxin module